MNDSTAIQKQSGFPLAKVIVCVILILSAMALAVELAPAGSDVGLTASAATKAELQKKQSQLETQQKNIASKLSTLKKNKAAAQDQLDLVNELVENLQTQITTVNNQIDAANAEIATLPTTTSSRWLTISPRAVWNRLLRAPCSPIRKMDRISLQISRPERNRK